MGLRPLAVAILATAVAIVLGLAGSPVGAEERVTEATAEPVTRPSTHETALVVDGVARYGRTLTARPPTWSGAPAGPRHQRLSGGEPVEGAPARSAARRPVRHRVDVRRTVTYHVEARGPLTTSRAAFERQVRQTYDDARGWRGAGVRFRRVARGGDFTVVLAAAHRVPAFSPVCSSGWSCRVGRYVVINQERWKHASPAWNAAGGTLRDYRHMVVAHETGHWLGHGHAGCGGRGRLAPVMMQQSKGLDGCRVNPWPTPPELRATG